MNAEMVNLGAQNFKLNKQTDMQTGVFERSRELFQREMKVKQELESLEKEKQQIEPRLPKLKKECQTYLDGSSWDASADSCDKQDQLNSRLSQITQMIHVHQMDLEQINAITKELGL
jgi:predicted nuclease with TOPRIM domain